MQVDDKFVSKTDNEDKFFVHPSKIQIVREGTIIALINRYFNIGIAKSNGVIVFNAMYYDPYSGFMRNGNDSDFTGDDILVCKDTYIAMELHIKLKINNSPDPNKNFNSPIALVAGADAKPSDISFLKRFYPTFINPAYDA